MSGPPFTMSKYSSELELLRAQNAWLSKEGEECRSRIAALEKSNERLYENEANHTEAYGMVCAERDRARGAMDRVMMVLFSIVPPVHGEGAIAPEETAQRVAAYAGELDKLLVDARCPNVVWHCDPKSAPEKRCWWCDARAAALTKGAALSKDTPTFREQAAASIVQTIAAHLSKKPSDDTFAYVLHADNTITDLKARDEGQPCSSMADPDAVAEYWRGRRCNCAVLPNCAHARSCPMYGSQGEPAVPGVGNPLDWPRALKAAQEANEEYRQWMPQAWIELFRRHYDSTPSQENAE